MSASTTLKEIADVLTEKRNDLRDAREELNQKLSAEPGNGTVIEDLRVIGMLQNLQVELARTTADTKVGAGSGSK